MHAHLAEVAGFADAALPDDAVFAQFLAIAEWPVPLYEMLKTSAAKSAGPTHRAMPGLSASRSSASSASPGPRQGPPRRARHSAAPSSAKPNAIHRAAQRHRDRHRPQAPRSSVPDIQEAKCSTTRAAPRTSSAAAIATTDAGASANLGERCGNKPLRPRRGVTAVNSKQAPETAGHARPAPTAKQQQP